MSLIFSIVVPAKVAPNVPPSTIRSAGMFRNAAGEAPSISAPTASPANATPIPIEVEAFMGGLPAYLPNRLSPGKINGALVRLARRLDGADDRRLAAIAPGGVRDRHAPVAHEARDVVRRLGHDHSRAGGERDHGVGMGLDRDDQVGVQVERLGLP